MDCYRDMRDVKRAFLEFMDRVPFYGMVVACNDDPLLRRLLPQVARRILTYGTRRGSDFRIKALPPGADLQRTVLSAASTSPTAERTWESSVCTSPARTTS